MDVGFPAGVSTAATPAEGTRGLRAGSDIFKPPNDTGQLTSAHDTLLSSTFCKDIFKAGIHTALKLGENDNDVELCDLGF